MVVDLVCFGVRISLFGDFRIGMRYPDSVMAVNDGLIKVSK